MPELHQVIAKIMSEISKAQSLSDSYSATLLSLYQKDPLLKFYQAPRLEASEVTIDLKFAFLGGATSSDSSKKVTIYQGKDFQGLSQELAVNSYDTASLTFYGMVTGQFYQIKTLENLSSASQDCGTWALGARSSQKVVALKVQSNNGGETLEGVMIYDAEGPIGFRAIRTNDNNYTVEHNTGAPSSPWAKGGNWILGSRPDKRVISLDLSSKDKGLTLSGGVSYDGEASVTIMATLVDYQGKFNSIKIPQGFKVSFFENHDESGHCKILTSDISSFEGDFHNFASKINVEIIPVEDLQLGDIEFNSSRLEALPESVISSVVLKTNIVTS